MKNSSRAGAGNSEPTKGYKSRIAAFVDILGFSDLIERTLNDSQAFELAYRLVETVSRGRCEWDVSQKARSSDPILEVRGARDEEGDVALANLRATYRTIAFSDSLVVSGPFHWGGIAFVLSAVSNLSLQLLKGGVFTRGGIAAGPLVHEDNLVFGPGLIRAYELESSVAQFPRVVLDSVTENYMMELVSNDLTAHRSDDINAGIIIGNILRTDKDRVTHLHLLGSTAMAVAGLLQHRRNFLYAVAETIRTRHRLAREANNERVAQKVVWFADYYNHTISREPELALEPVSLE